MSLVNSISTHSVKQFNIRLSTLSLPWLLPIKVLKRLQNTKDDLSSETIAKFRYDSAGIGNKFPRDNRIVKQDYYSLCLHNANIYTALLDLATSAVQDRRN